MRKALIAIAVIIVGALIIFYYVRPSEKIEEKSSIPPMTSVNQYPFMSLTKADGTTQLTRDLTGKNILFIYFPDCDHCQREAAEVQRNVKAFASYTLWFISSAPFPEIESFSKKYLLTGYDNIEFAHTEMEDVISNFGGIPTPSVYIFSDGKFVKAFNGETKIEEIINFL